MSGITLLPAAGRQPQPWKNGGGTTTGIAVFPPDAGLEDFDWRISMASVTAAGPFSHFECVDRVLAVIEGELDLTFEDASVVRLAPDRPPHAFPGDAGVIGTPVGERVVDLNLMMRRGRWTGLIERIETPYSVSLAVPIAIMLFLGEGHLRVRETAVTMRPFDAARIDVTGCETVDLASEDDVYLIALSPARA